MAQGLLDIRSRIKSVKNTRQVTKAMEAVSASKMRKSVSRALSSKEYSQIGRAMLKSLAKQEVVQKHPLVRKREGSMILMLIITSNRGLCAGYNAQLIRGVTQYLKQVGKEQVDFVCLGKKGQLALKRLNLNFLAAFEPKDNPESRDTLAISQFLINEYLTKNYSKVMIAFTDFRSTASQDPTIRQLLPASDEIEELIGPNLIVSAPENQTQVETEYLFEPDAEQLINNIIPRLIETQVYQTLLESLAAEHVLRMMAMRNATDNATQMIDGLTQIYNQIRQSTITQEIAEISATRAAFGE